VKYTTTIIGAAALSCFIATGCDDDDDNEGTTGNCDVTSTGTATTTTGPGGSGGNGAGGGAGGGGEVVPLKEAKLIIEHNATDLDTGFQGFLDGEGWERIDVSGPRGQVLRFEGLGSLKEHGLTELFFETVEPENAEVPIDELLTLLPEGEYTFSGPTVDGGFTEGTATLTHDIPAGAVLMTPAEGAVVPLTGLVMSWGAVTQTINGDPVTITSYQLIIEKDEPPPPNSIGKRGLSMYLPPTVTSMSIPTEFLEPATAYAWEVLAIEQSGNQTLSSGTFETQ
jgi:hypothetical protein